MRFALVAAVSAALLASAPAVFAQDPLPPPATSGTTPPGQPAGVLSGTASGTYDRRDALPAFNLYLPEGQASLRLRKLIKNVLFESQIDYKFVNGDISTYLRYKYYARNFTYRIGVFDTIGFPDVGRSSEQEFQRVRGGLFLIGVPRDYNNRYFWLVQDDRLTFGDTNDPDNRKNNIYTKIGYQYGTEFDERMNAIVGESRGRIIPVLTAFRDIGPQKVGLAAAVTQSGKLATGDYQYTKFEAEALKRSDLTSTSFLVTRMHLGTFLARGKVKDPVDPLHAYTAPVYEMFQLGGREALRSIGSKDEATGTHELHLTNEYFVPIFRNKDYRTSIVHWNTMYGIGYAGAGTVGFEFQRYAKLRDYVVDAGLGTEMSLTIRDFDVLLSVIYAHTVHAPDDLSGGKVRFSIRTIR